MRIGTGKPLGYQGQYACMHYKEYKEKMDAKHAFCGPEISKSRFVDPPLPQG